MVSHLGVTPSPNIFHSFFEIYLTYSKTHSLKFCNSGHFKIYSQHCKLVITIQIKCSILSSPVSLVVPLQLLLSVLFLSIDNTFL